MACRSLRVIATSSYFELLRATSSNFEQLKAATSEGVRDNWAVQTRTLLLLAAVTGLVILVASAVFLLRVSSSL
jgi:hypothetical protein